MLCMGDNKSHPQTAEINKYLDELMWKPRQAGYVPETDSMMHELEASHSIFGLTNCSEGSTIRIIKNLRMCDDCHSAIKFISTVITCREIIVRVSIDIPPFQRRPLFLHGLLENQLHVLVIEPFILVCEASSVDFSW
ncbi:Pentatricopeptide repeat-containing protein [Thalictrum thalictroides]|uniref:Pentatricopeptide repeat-containing protein n=1 Tax=Thalictrum thalictroides TaxID=46969 RepID=A0A7J6UY67_THATH|nr:Pentatricopeptide repeat-containing protein [Thalictrum thalictroides]